MSKAGRSVASVYAKVSFAVAKDIGVPVWSSFVDYLQGVLSDPVVCSWIEGDYGTSLADKSMLLVAGFEMAAQYPECEAFAQLIIKNKRVSLIGDITRIYHDMVEKQNGVIRATVEVAALPDQERKQAFESLLRGIVHGSSDLKIVYKCDPALLAGFNIRLGDNVLRASLRNDISQLFV